MTVTLDVVVSDVTEPFSEDDLERVRASGVECSFYEDTTTHVVLWVPIDVCDNSVIKVLRGGAHPNLEREHNLHG